MGCGKIRGKKKGLKLKKGKGLHTHPDYAKRHSNPKEKWYGPGPYDETLLR